MASVVPPEVLAILRCPACGSAAEAQDGGVVCATGHEIASSNGYLDALFPNALDPDTRRTLASFGYEWTRFDTVQPEDELFWRRYFADVPLEELEGKLALDAGCGKGRFSYFTAPHVGALVALDGSAAAAAAARNLASRPNAVVVKSDVRRAPFANDSFDFIFCLGVIHHLADPEEGFRELVRLLAPEGLLLLYIYSRPERRGARSIGLSAASLLRRLTRRLPRPLLRALSLPIAGLLYLAIVIPGQMGVRTRIRELSNLPLHTYRGQPLRSLWLDTFDRLSAPLERRYIWPDISPWFVKAGLTVIRLREDAGLIVLARKQVERRDDHTSSPAPSPTMG